MLLHNTKILLIHETSTSPPFLLVFVFPDKSNINFSQLLKDILDHVAQWVCAT